MVDKGTHRHFMAKEIFEQPEVISNTFGHYIDGARDAITLPEMGFDFNDINRIAIIACGTAHAGMVAKTWFERMSGILTVPILPRVPLPAGTARQQQPGRFCFPVRRDRRYIGGPECKAHTSKPWPVNSCKARLTGRRMSLLTFAAGKSVWHPPRHSHASLPCCCRWRYLPPSKEADDT